MIYLLYGSDTDRSHEKLNEIIDEYRKKSGSVLNFHQLDAEEENLEKLGDLFRAGSLFSLKKLVVIKYISLSSWDSEDFTRMLGEIKKDTNTVVVIWDRELPADKISSLSPYCQRVQEFKKPEAKIEMPDASIFRLGDTFFTSSRDGVRNLLKLLDEGHDDFNLFSYLSNHARTLFIVKSHIDEGRAVPAKYGIHPYVVKKAAPLVKSFPVTLLPLILKRFFEEDHKVKTGIKKPREALEHMLIGVCCRMRFRNEQ